MTTNIATDNLQSHRLLSCGVSADTADMIWTRFESDGEKYEQLSVMDESAYEVASLNPTPAWSLSALLTKVLPHNISVDKYKYKGATEYEVGCYFTGHRDKIAFNAPDPIEACVQLIEWLTENNYKLNEQ